MEILFFILNVINIVSIINRKIKVFYTLPELNSEASDFQRLSS